MVSSNSGRAAKEHSAVSWLECSGSPRTNSGSPTASYPRESKPILDAIDTVLAGHYGFTPEELDFILNYDIKYRLGRETESEEE